MPKTGNTAAIRKRNRRGAGFKPLPKGDQGGVKLLLIQSVDNLGRQGEIVEVRPGFANNYLIPQGLATIASDHHVRMVEKHREKLLELEKKRLSGLRKLADDLAKVSLTIEANANDEGHLYGSVGAAEIVSGLRQQDHHISTDQVRLEGPLRELGLYTVKLQLHADVVVEIKVWVVPTAGEGAAK